jgi:Carboxypeptidase regulatory-like domain
MSLDKRVVLGGLIALLSLASTPARAQFASTLEGIVTDPSGAVVPAATVTITNEATGVAQTGYTTKAGYYRFPALPGGLYTIKVTLTGFKSWAREHVRLESTQIRAVNIALEMGSANAEEVTVTAEAPLVETSQARVSGLIQESQVKDLPLIGRNFFNLVVLTPGVTGRATGGGQAYAQSNADIYNNEYGVNMNANGARTESNNFMVDSGTVSSSQRSGVVNVNPNAEMVEEVRVMVNNFAAEYGRNGSVLVNVITKSGSNDYHGSLGVYYTNDSLQSKNYFQGQTPNFTIPDFGRKEFSWGFGGPIRKDKTFFFVSGDVLRSDVAVSGVISVLTPQFISLMQDRRPSNISTRIARDFPASFTPDRNFRTAGQILGSSCTGSTPIDTPIGPVPCDFQATGSGIWNETSPRNGFQWTARIDHHFRGGKDRIYASFNRTTTDKVGFGTPEVYPAFTANSPTSSMQLNTNWTRIMSSNLVNEMSFSWARPWGELENVHADIPGISVTGIQGYQVGWGPNIFVQNNFLWSDVVSWTRGSHSMKFGGGYTLERADNDSARAITRPTFSFNNVFDFANDAPFSESQIPLDPRTGTIPDSIKRYHRTQSFNVFVQDEWKLRRNLTISAGVRFEYFMNITDVSDNMVTNIEFPVDTGNLQSDLASARMVQREYYLSGGVFGPQHVFAPRVSFAWDPTSAGRMSVRGGFGRFYDRMSNQIWDSEHQNLPGYANAATTVQQPVKPLFALGGSNVLPYGFPFPVGLTAGVRPNGGLVNGTASVVAADSNTPTEYLENWFLGVQRALGKYVVVEANYIGSRGHDMYYRWDINRFAGDLLDGRLDRIMPGYAAVNYMQAVDKSHYNGVNLSVRVQRSDLNLGAAYTYGKAIDNSSSFSGTQRPDAYGPNDQDEGPTDFDVRQKLALSLNWKLPGPKSGAAKAILGGWQVAGILIAQSGVPYTVFCGASFTAGCDYNADGTNFDRPNVPGFGDSKDGSNDDFLRGIFAASDFPKPAPGTNGALGRNTFRGPRYFNVDMALVKSIRVPQLGQASELQLRVESFNLFNTVNLNNPIANLADPNFGKSTSALPGRIVQFSARFQF